MTFEGNDNQQDANLGETSAAPESSQDNATETSAAESQERQASAETPFHEHPRFKELISERNTFKERLEAMEARYQQMESQRQQTQQKEHPFVARLKEIDPSYGEWAGGVEQFKKEFEELRAWKQEQSRQSLINEYTSGIDKLHNENKVPENLRGRIKKEIDFRAMTNPKLGLKDLPSIYKEVMEEETKFVEGLKRSERASYVTDKSKDAKAPQTQTKGAVATGAQKQQQHRDREDAYSSIVKKALSNSKAGNDF